MRRKGKDSGRRKPPSAGTQFEQASDDRASSRRRTRQLSRQDKRREVDRVMQQDIKADRAKQ